MVVPTAKFAMVNALVRKGTGLRAELQGSRPIAMKQMVLVEGTASANFSFSIQALGIDHLVWLLGNL